MPLTIPLYPRLKKPYSYAALFSLTAVCHRLTLSQPARPKVFKKYFPARVLQLMPDPNAEVL